MIPLQRNAASGTCNCSQGTVYGASLDGPWPPCSSLPPMFLVIPAQLVAWRHGQWAVMPLQHSLANRIDGPWPWKSSEWNNILIRISGEQRVFLYNLVQRQSPLNGCSDGKNNYKCRISHVCWRVNSFEINPVHLLEKR